MPVAPNPLELINASFGRGYYQLTHLQDERGESQLRAPMTPQRQYALVQNPKGDSNYRAQANLLRTYFEIQAYLLKNAILQEKLSHLGTDPSEQQVLPCLMQNSVSYAVVDLDRYADLFAMSEENPEEYYWVVGLSEDKTQAAYLCYHNQEVSVFSKQALIILGQETNLQSLAVHTLSKVLINRPLKAKNGIHINCQSLLLDSEQSKPLLDAALVNIVCFDTCTTTKNTDLLTQVCQIRAGTLQHHGHIESTQGTTHITAELIDIHGSIAAKAGINMVSLGIQTQVGSHLHGSSINLMVGSPENTLDTAPSFLGKLILNGDLSGKGLNLYSHDITFNQGSLYIQGRINLGTIHKIKANKAVKVFFRGDSLNQYSQFASFMDWTLIEDPLLEIFFKVIIHKNLNPNLKEQLRSDLPQALVHNPAKRIVPKLRDFEFFPVLPEKESYSYKTYNKAQFIPLPEVEPSHDKPKAASQMVFSAAEYLSMRATMSLASARVSLEAEDLECSMLLSKSSDFGSLDVFTKSQALDLHGVIIDSDGRGQVLFFAQKTSISDSTLFTGQITVNTGTLNFPKGTTRLEAAEKISLKSKYDSRLEKDSKLVLNSPLQTWEASNLYLRGHMEFQQLCIKAEHTVALMQAHLQGKNLQIDAEIFAAWLSIIEVRKTFSVHSVATISAFSLFLSELYINTSGANLSLGCIYLPSSVSVSGRSFLSIFLASTNTLISVLQLVLHDPTAQVALSATRLVINVGPALVQLYQLAKNINKVSQAPQIERAQFIQIVNQVKTICLSLGGIAFSVPGLVDQFGHISSAEECALPSWDNVTTVLNNLRGVTAPLLNAFSSLQNSNGLNVEANLSAVFSSSTSSLVDMHTGLGIECITSARSTVIDAVLPGAIDVTPVATKMSLYSVSFSPEAILPIGSYSERTWSKFNVGLLPALPQHTSLSTNKMTLIFGPQAFAGSTLQVTDFQVQSDAEVLVENSSFTAAHTDNAGQAIFSGCHLNIKDWQNAPCGSVLWEQSLIRGMELNNQGFVQYRQSRAQFSQVDNSSKSTTIAFNATLDFRQETSEFGAKNQMVGTECTLAEWKESGLVAIDAHSNFKVKKAQFTDTTQIGLRSSNIDIEEVENPANIPICLDFQGEMLKQTSGHLSHEDKSELTATVKPSGRVQYHSDKPYVIKNAQLISELPLGVDASQLTVQGLSSSTTSFTLEGSQSLTLQQAGLRVNGALNLQGGEVVADGGTFEAGTVDVRGKKITTKEGAKFLAQSGIQVESEEDLSSIGKKTTETHTETHRHWLIIKDTKKTETDSFDNTVFATAQGDVSLLSKGTMLLQGTDLAAPEGANHVWTENNLSIRPNLGENRVEDQHSILIQSDTDVQTKDVAAVCHFQSAQETTFHSEHGDYHNVGSVIDAQKQVVIEVDPDHQAINERLSLKYSEVQSHTGLYLKSVAGFDLSSPNGTAASHIPLVTSLSQLNQAQGFMDGCALTLGFGEEALNLVQKGLAATKKGQVLPEVLKQFKLGDAHGLNPTLEWQLGKSEQSQHGTVLGSGSITTPEFILRGGAGEFQQGYKVDAQHGVVDVGILKSEGGTVSQTTNSSSTQLNLSTSLTHYLDAGLSHQQQGTTIVQHAETDNLNFKVLDLNAKEVELQDSSLVAETLRGHVDDIVSKSSMDTIKSSGYQVSLSSSGNFSVGNQNNHKETVAVPVAFQVKDAQDFSCNTMELTGQTAPNINAAQVETTPLYDKSHSHSFHISASLADFLPKNEANMPLFSALNFSTANHHYLAEHTGNGIKVLQDSTDHVLMNCPIYHSKAGKQFVNDLHELLAPPLKDATSFASTPVYINRPSLLKKPLQQTNAHPQAHTPKTRSQSSSPLFPRSYMNLGDIPSSLEGVTSYRGTLNGLSVFDEGFTAPGEDLDVRRHCEEWSLESGIVSTSFSDKIAEGFPKSVPFGETTGFLYKITSTRPTINVPEELIAQNYPTLQGEDLDVYLEEEERGFIKKIYPHEIEGAWKVSIAKHPGVDPEGSIWEQPGELDNKDDILDNDIEGNRNEPFPDSNFRPQTHIGWNIASELDDNDDDDLIDDILDNDIERTRKEPFIPNPNFRPQAQIVWNIARELGHAWTGIGAALDAKSLYDAYQQNNTLPEAARIVGGWSGAFSMGSLFAEQSLLYCAPLAPAPIAEAVCVTASTFVGSGIGYYMGSEGVKNIIKEDVLPSLGTILEELIPPAFGAEEKPVENASVVDGVASVVHHTKEFLTNYSNMGLFVEVFEKDVHRSLSIAKSFKELVQSSEMGVYLKNVEQSLGKEAAFTHFINYVVEPFASNFYNQGSYFHELFVPQDSVGSLYNTKTVYDQPHLQGMAEKVAENAEHTAHFYERVLLPFRCFYMASMALEYGYALWEHEPVLSKLKNEVYSLYGSIACASLTEPVLPWATELTVSLLQNTVTRVQPINWAWKFALPIAGVLIGGDLGTTIAQQDNHHTMDISIALAAGKEVWQAGELRKNIAAEFKSLIFPHYGNDVLSKQSLATYYEYMASLEKQSTTIGKALMNPVSKDLLELSRIASSSFVAEDLVKSFAKEITNENFMEFVKFAEHSETKPIYDVDGPFFRKMMEGSDFSPDRIKQLRNLGKFLFFGAAVEGLYEVVKSPDPLNEAGRLGTTFAATEIGGELGAAAGTALCGASPPCILGAALVGAVASNKVAEKCWESIPRLPHFAPEPQLDYAKQLSLAKQALCFFKPSEREGGLEKQASYTP